MDTAAAQWPHQQDIVVAKPMEEMMMMMPLPKPSSSSSVQERNKAMRRPHKEQGVGGRSSFSCPRCNSINTKFCYYNNYSLSQPRFFCKTCRRYWTQGGSLRNIPVGGASRRNNKTNIRPSSSHNNNNNNNSKKLPDPVPPQQQNPSNSNGSKEQDLNLGFSAVGFKSFADMIQLPAFQNPSSLDLLTAATPPSSRVLYNNYAFMPVVGSGCHSFPELNKSSSLNFSLDGLGGNYGGFQGAQENNHHHHNNNSSSSSSSHDKNKILFPFEDLKQDSSTDRDDDQHQNGDPSNGFWNGVLGGGSW